MMARGTDEDTTEADAAPWLPPGRAVELADRGTTFVRELPGPPGAPTVLLLHGWTATADLNFFTCYEALGRRFRVVALDHRGHGRGIRSRKPFRLLDCADDAAALLDTLGVERAIATGYSMGGPIAQLLWRRHPDKVQALVLCATAKGFSSTREERIGFFTLASLAAAARLTPTPARNWIAAQVMDRRARDYHEWAYEQMRDHDWRALLEAGRALGTFSSATWIGQVDVPVAQLLTMRDLVVPLRRQLRLLEAIPGAKAYRVDGGHDAVIANADAFVPTLVAACTHVAERSRTNA
jgi:3-oxoadipate enol-lactonase